VTASPPDVPIARALPLRTPFAEMTVGAHRVALLKDGGQAFPAMLDAIASARSTICLETYILRADGMGGRFAAALSERARAGVEVNVLYDAWGSSLPGEWLDALEASGVRTVAYHPIRFSGKRREIMGRLERRDHRKALIVDSRVGFTGGINVSDEYAAVEDGGEGWRDTHVRLEGPAAMEMQFFFLDTWRRAGGAPIDEPRYGTDGRRPDPRVSVVSTHQRRMRTAIRDAYLTAIRGAKQRIWITNAYFLPRIRFLRALGDAARRGVDVRVMVAGTTDVPAVLYASREIYERLLRAGVRLYEWEGSVLHAKTAVVDGRWATVGSSNLDMQSLRQNLEANAILRDTAFAAALERMFVEDMASCREISQERWSRRPVWLRAASWGAYLLRRWL
jgi:cardiolipin synthase A/B